MIDLLSPLYLFAPVLIFTIGCCVLSRGAKSGLNRNFFFLCLSAALWGLGEYKMFGAAGVSAAFFPSKLGSLRPFTFALILHFPLVFTGRGKGVRRRAASELSRQVAYLEGLFMNSAEAIVHTDTKGRVIRVNPAFMRMFGYPADEVIGAELIGLVVPEDQRENARRFGEAALSGSAVNAEAVRRRKDGCLIHVSILGVPIKAGENLLGVYIVYRDITERKKVEEALRESEAQYRQLFECAGDGIVIHDLEGHLLDANEVACRGLGYTRGELLQKKLDDIVGGDLAGKTGGLMGELEARGCLVFECMGITKDGRQVSVEINSRFIAYRGKRAILSIVRDVSERKEAAAALKESEQRLLQSQKMEAVGRLAGGVAHDFNNLLTAISGFSEIILMKEPVSGDTRKYLMEIKKSTERAASLTHQLLAFSRKQVMQPRIVDLNRLIADLQKMLRRLIGENIELFTVLDPELWQVKADPAQIEQVVMNLAVNSRDAMPGGGELIIETKNVEKGGPEDGGDNSDLAPGSYVMFSVTDTGQGMHEETKRRIFEPFFTTKEPGKGTGLGLSIVFGIVKQSGGAIAVSSEPGNGTLIKVYLPRATGEEKRVEVVMESRLKDGHETILVVEDEEVVRIMLGRMLRNFGYTVLEAKSVYDALSIAERNTSGRIHLMVTDIVMPGMNGKELAALFTRVRPETKVLYISGYAEGASTDQSVIESGAPFLQKPFNPQALATKVREVLDCA